jgi:hypothetical protein
MKTVRRLLFAAFLLAGLWSTPQAALACPS